MQWIEKFMLSSQKSSLSVTLSQPQTGFPWLGSCQTHFDHLPSRTLCLELPLPGAGCSADFGMLPGLKLSFCNPLGVSRGLMLKLGTSVVSRGLNSFHTFCV